MDQVFNRASPEIDFFKKIWMKSSKRWCSAVDNETRAASVEFGRMFMHKMVTCRSFSTTKSSFLPAKRIAKSFGKAVKE